MDCSVFPVTEREAKKAGVKYSSEINRNSRFARRLAQLRSDAGMSQAKLAEILDVSKSTISLYEVGDTVPDAKMIVKLAEIFNVSCDYFLCQTDYRSSENAKMTANDIGLSEASANSIQDLQMYHVDGRLMKVDIPYGPSAVLNLICEDERFREMFRVLSSSYQMYIGAERAKETPQEDISNLELIGARGVLTQAGEIGVRMDDAAEFYLQRACDLLKEIIHAFPRDKDADGQELRIDVRGNAFNPILGRD